MTIKEFRLLPFDKKCSFVTFRGRHLAKRSFGRSKVYLFQLEKFFAEIWCNSTTNKVHGVNAFDSIKGLDIYLEKIGINEIQKVLGPESS